VALRFPPQSKTLARGSMAPESREAFWSGQPVGVLGVWTVTRGARETISPF
jgi:hypothetical protein